MVDTSLEVLIQKCLEFFILLIQKTSLLDQILSVNEKGVILGQSFVKCSPDGKSLVRKDLGHSLPENSLFSLLSLLLLFLRLEIRFLFHGWVAHEILVVQFLFSPLMEILQNLNGVIQIDVRVVGLLLLEIIVIIVD